MSLVAESPRHDTVGAREDHPRATKEPPPIGSLLSPKGDTVRDERETGGSANWQGGAGTGGAERLAHSAQINARNDAPEIGTLRALRHARVHSHHALYAGGKRRRQRAKTAAANWCGEAMRREQEEAAESTHAAANRFVTVASTCLATVRQRRAISASGSKSGKTEPRGYFEGR